MKLRQEKIGITDAEEHELEASVRSLAVQSGGDGSAGLPPPVYWQNLIVRINTRIDREESGKMLSIHWALRVAIPGVVAILSFVIGLHYYVPQRATTEESVSAVILSLPAQSVDSLLLNPSPLAVSLSIAEVGGNLFDMTQEQIADYLIHQGSVQILIESMSDQQLGDVMVELGAHQD
jgi:hypothetical protein